MKSYLYFSLGVLNRAKKQIAFFLLFTTLSSNFRTFVGMRLLTTLLFVLLAVNVQAQCTDPITPEEVWTTDVYATEAYCWATCHWTATEDAYRYLIRRRALGEAEWTYVGGVDFITETNRAIGFLEFNTTYEWSVRTHCTDDNDPYSEWSVSDTFSTGNFIPAEFTPDFSISLADSSCAAKTDLIFEIEQGLNEPDMASTAIFSDGGSFDIASLSLLENVGYADMMVGGGFANYSYTLFVGQIVSDDEAVISMQNNDTWMIDGSFTIQNENGGIKIIQQIPNEDDNSYTTGNESTIVLEDIFLTPTESTVVDFSSMIVSELDDDATISHDFTFDCHTAIEEWSQGVVYPNPTEGLLYLDLAGEKQFVLRNLNGQIVYQAATNAAQINLSALASGLYFIEITTEGHVYREKLVLR